MGWGEGGKGEKGGVVDNGLKVGEGLDEVWGGLVVGYVVG